MRIVGDDGEALSDDAIVLAADKPHDRLEAIGLSPEEGKNLLAQVQHRFVAAQADAFVAANRGCAHCGQTLRRKGRVTVTFRTAFGTVPIDSPRLHRCPCSTSGSRTFSPLTALFTSHVAPELLHLECRWASLISYGMTVAFLKDVLPIDARLNPKTVRNHLHRVALHAEAALGDERPNFIGSCPADWRDLPPPEGEIVIGIDGGYVRDWVDKKGYFGVLTGQVAAA